MAFNYKDYNPSDEVNKKKLELENHTATQAPQWTGGTYGQALQDAMNRIQNREKFSYDLNGDALYQQYKDRYINQGRLAMMDTLGQASALTGGYGNSYASTAGNQAYQGYLTKLNDVVPQLYQMAYDKYDREGQDLYNQYNMINNAYNQEYGQYRDALNDWNKNYNRLNDAYNTERNFDYGQYSDAYSRAMNNYQFEKNLALDYAKLNKSSGSYEEQIKKLIGENNYKDALLYIGNGIEEINGIEFKNPADMDVNEFVITNATKEKNKKTTNAYKFDGHVYATREAAEKALIKKLDEYNLTEEQLNSIFAKLGM